MAKILDVYKKYKIVPLLQDHQLRVAAVAKLICDANDEKNLDKEMILQTCLLHDMGNILKFDFKQFPEFFEPKGIDYWQGVRDELAKRYKTNDEHVATVEIAKEIGVNDKVLAAINLIGFRELPRVANDSSYEQKVCNYSDMRVGPLGILSIEERLADGDRRYEGRIQHSKINSGESVQSLRKIENEIFTNLSIKPTDISDATVAPVLEKLRATEL